MVGAFPLSSARPWGGRPCVAVLPMVPVWSCGCVAVWCVLWRRVVRSLFAAPVLPLSSSPARPSLEQEAGCGFV